MNDLQVFNALDEGCALCKLIRDTSQNAIDFRFIEINPAVERLLGVTRANVVGRLASRVYSNEYQEWMPTLESAAKSVTPQRVEQYSRTTGRWFEIKASSIGDDQVVVLFGDIAERKQMEEALRKSEERYRMLFDSISEIFGLLEAVYDDNGSVIDFRYLEINSATERAVGMSCEQVVGQRLSVIFPRANPMNLEAMVKVIETGIPIDLETYSSVVDQWQQTHFWSPGKGLVATLSTDITERKRAEETLRISEERFRFTLANSPVIVANLDRDLRYTWIYNPARGFKPEDVVGKTVGIGTDPETTKRLRQSLSNVVTHGAAIRLELDIRMDTGIRYFELRAEPLRDARGEITGVSMLSIDVTEFKRAEEERQKAERRYGIVGDVIPFGVWESDVEGNAIYLSPLFLELTGLTLEQHRQSWQTLIHAEQTDSVVQAWRECVQSGATWDQEFRIRGKDGNYYAIHARGLPVHNSDGEITSYVGINFDVTDHRRVEEALRESERQLQLLNASLEGQVQEKTAETRKLAAEVTQAVQRERHRLSHILHDDLQQRIYAIQMQLGFLRNGLQMYGEQDQKEALDIEAQLLEVLEITRNLSIELSPPILREEGLTQAISWLAHQMLQRYRLPIEIQADEPFAIQDEALHVFLFSCVREILFNTVKHAEASHAVVALRWVENCLEIKVQDDGKGFPADRFEEQSAEEPTSPSLGIPTIRQQLSLFGGSMDIQSAPGTGTSILITVPIPERG